MSYKEEDIFYFWRFSTKISHIQHKNHQSVTISKVDWRVQGTLFLRKRYRKKEQHSSFYFAALKITNHFTQKMVRYHKKNIYKMF